MKRPASRLLVILLLSAGMVSSGMAIELTAGQRTYLLHCKSCHGNGVKGAAMKRQAEWEELFEDDASALRALHAKTPVASYFESCAFKAAAADLYSFLFNYAADSGNVPTCM